MKPGVVVTLFAMSMGAQIPFIAEKPLSACGCKKFQIDALGDHLCTCTAHSGAKKAHDWAVDQIADLFRTTHKVKTKQVPLEAGVSIVGTPSWLATSRMRMRRAQCLWCWTFASHMRVGEVALTLLLMETYITLMI
jgi:hypothetical protein